jgi:hypothetical protein
MAERFVEVGIPVSEPEELRTRFVSPQDFDRSWDPHMRTMRVSCFAEEHRPGEFTPCIEAFPGNQPWEFPITLDTEIGAISAAVEFLWTIKDFDDLAPFAHTCAGKVEGWLGQGKQVGAR